MIESSAPRRQRIVLCMGEFCNMGRRADKLYQQLQPVVRGDPRFKLEMARCLNMCGAGPNLVIYPEGKVYNQMDAAKLAEVIREEITPGGGRLI